MVTKRADIASKFENGDIPSSSDFAQIFDSFVHKDEDKADFQMVEAGISNEHYITPALLKTAFQNAGILSGNYFTPYKEFKDNFSGSFIQLSNSLVEDSAKVYKNGQLMTEDEDYTLDNASGIITFNDSINNRNIEVNYWSKNTDSASNTDPLLGSLSIPYKENFEGTSFSSDKITLKELPIEQSVRVYKNGQLLREGTDKDYSINYDNGLLTFSSIVTDRNIEVDYWYKSSISLSDLELDTKYVDLSTAQTIGGNKTFTEAVQAKSFIKTGGTANQYLMADGSVSTSGGSDYDAGHAGFGFPATGGYQKFSNGLILQWAYLMNGSTTYSFPLTWPKKAASVVVSTYRNSSGSRGFNHVYDITSSSYTAIIDGTTGYMFAIGY